ncbi:pilus assembly protein [Acinetobacter haemolyticus]|uniref:pilus assembly protein n=1 Tax=Acinetobacter haemolyticus TaxID=29430 RepID=UPI0021CDDB9A|nr:PilC/PilY family type IV pilus protein [Acinetobacter haemolyticus]MCU4378598.1 hypothetical protein [Acinetobacter haemolyticus]
MNNNKMKKSIKRKPNQSNKMKGLLMSCSVLAGFFVLSSVASASDIEIYRQGSSGGESTIMLMVDTSQSMGSPALDLLKDYPLCISSKIFGVVGALPVVDVKLGSSATSSEAYCDVVFPKSVLDLLGTVDTLTGTGSNSLLGLKSSLDYMRASCTPFSKLESGEPARSSKILEVNINLGEGYRCYSRLSRIKIAVRDVLNGNDAKGIQALSDKTVIGLSIAPAKQGALVNQKAGMIVIPAKPLDAAQRVALKNAIDGLVPSADPLGNTLDKVVGILGNVLDNINILGLVNDVLGLVGSLPATVTALLNNPESPVATTYAETGAYLLGHSTKGTGERLSEYESPAAKPNVVYKCLSRQADQDCSSYEDKSSGLLGLSREPIEYIKANVIPTSARSQTVTPSNGLLGNLLGGLLGGNKSVIRYYLVDNSVYSGHSYRAASVPLKANGDDYDNPSSIKSKVNDSSTPQCQAQGIFVLTGSVPKITPADELGLQRVMQKSLGQAATTSIGDFCTATPPSGWQTGTATATWACIANYSKALLDTNTNYRTQVEIKTGVAGIGKEFNYVRLEGNTVVGAGTGGSIVNTLLSSVKSLLNAALGLLSIVVDLRPVLNLVDVILPTQPTTAAEIGDVKNLAYWGKEGKGGWYTEASTGGIAQSIIEFSQHIVDAESDPFMGLQNIPVDPLTPYRLNDEVYNSIFIPTNKASWLGNLKKYAVEGIKTTADGIVDNSMRKIQALDQWNDNSIEATDGSTLLQGGMLAKLEDLRPEVTDESARQLWINRSCKEDGSFSESDTLKQITVAYAADISNDRCALDSSARDDKTGYLMNLLGYDVDPKNYVASGLASSEPMWKMGMPFHSTPLKITQSAQFYTVTQGGKQVEKMDRQDYIVFGSTQGLLHIVDASDGQEQFAFVPNEMLENEKQREAFSKNGTSGTWRDMPYGIDGAWTAYTEYVYGVKDGKMVATVDQVVKGTNQPQGKQILYGGLRMGGRSYYALDLTDLSEPEIKFHIDPDKAEQGTPLSYMGQSWSKPTIAYVNWHGERKQVMLVGGGYDDGYEAKDYTQANKKGAGVYMFDANNGELLWWVSANASTSNQDSLKVPTMQYSVVSRINVADRDGDGLVDHLYFGDLGGQVWRVDLAAAMSSNETLLNRAATRLLNLNSSNGTSPRFYDAPSFSVYGYERPLAVVSIASGNRSLPASDPSSGAIYNIFDRDVTRTDLFTTGTFTALTKDLDITTEDNQLLTALPRIDGKNLVEVKEMMLHGWAVTFDHGKKVMDELAVINKNLYASVYDPGEEPTCPVQVRGETQVHRYCLPFGVCEQELQSEQTNSFVAGKGIVALNVGSGVSNNEHTQARSLIRNTDVKEGEMSPVHHQMRRHLVPLRWYEDNE